MEELKRSFKLLSIDSLGGLAVGIATVFLVPYISSWYGWSPGFTLYMGLVNIAYGCFSGVQALRLKRKKQISQSMIIILVIANSVWAGQCFTQAWWQFESSSFLGLGHLILEGLYVGVLAFLEARLILPLTK